MRSSQGVVGQFYFDADADKLFDSVSFAFTIDGKKYFSYPAKGDFAKSVGKDGFTHYRYIGQLNYLIDADGKVLDYTALAKGIANLELVVAQETKTMVQASLVILPAE